MYHTLWDHSLQEFDMTCVQRLTRNMYCVRLLTYDMLYANAILYIQVLIFVVRRDLRQLQEQRLLPR